MDGESSGAEEVVPLCTLPEWADVEPLVLKETWAPVVAIQYEPHHAEELAYFRAILAKGELSERALELTADMIEANQADYTAWEWRWRCLRHLGTDLTTEYAFTDSVMHDNAKNYQLWNHRRKCALALGPGAAAHELSVADDALGADPKNYHAWAHRQAIIQAFGGELWAAELAYCDKHIAADVRNNSAWNQRAFVVRAQLGAGTGGAGAPASVMDDLPELPPQHPAAGLPAPLPGLVLRELQLLALQIARAPRNESAWAYLSGLFVLPGMPPFAMGLFEEVAIICREALNDAPCCPPALEAFAAFYSAQAGLAVQQQQRLLAGGGALQQSVMQALQEAVVGAVGCCTTLLDALLVADPVRSMYWRHRLHGVQALYAASLGGQLAQPGGAEGG